MRLVQPAFSRNTIALGHRYEHLAVKAARKMPDVLPEGFVVPLGKAPRSGP